MDQLLSKAGSTLVTFAVRSGVQVASTYVIKSVSTLMANVPEHEKRRLERKKDELQNKIETVTYSIEMIQLMAVRGNSSLESVLKLADYLREDINTFSKDIAIVTSDSMSKRLSADSLKLVERSIDDLVVKIDKLVPLLSLVLTTYGTSSVNNFQDYVSPGRLLNATTLVDKSNTLFTQEKNSSEIKVGPTFSLTFYNIFYNQSQTSESHIIWREKYARCKFQIYRIPKEGIEYYYELRIVEDFDDGRYHDDDERKGEWKFDITLISKLFFSASGKLLKLEDKSTPVLVFKLRKESKRSKAVLCDDDYEWVAFGDYEFPPDSEDSESDGEEDVDDASESDDQNLEKVEVKPEEKADLNISKPSPLSLLEYIVRLCAVQANDQTSIIDIKDERLRLYLSDENYNSEVSQQIKSLSKKMDDLKL